MPTNPAERDAEELPEEVRKRLMDSEKMLRSEVEGFDVQTETARINKEVKYKERIESSRSAAELFAVIREIGKIEGHSTMEIREIIDHLLDSMELDPHSKFEADDFEKSLSDVPEDYGLREKVRQLIPAKIEIIAKSPNYVRRLSDWLLVLCKDQELQPATSKLVGVKQWNDEITKTEAEGVIRILEKRPKKPEDPYRFIDVVLNISHAMRLEKEKTRGSWG